MLRKLLVGLSPLVAVVAIAMAPSSAVAYQYEHHYCNNSLAPGGTCPPSGSSEWAHLEVNEGDAGGQSHETCIDEYLSNSGYTGATCMYYAGEETHQFPGGEYGYPRAWNGGSVTHQVVATEYGYHTAAAVKPPLASANSGAQALPTAVVQGMSGQLGVDPSSAVFAGGAYPTWVVSGSTEVCLIRAAARPGDVPAGVCGSKAAAGHGLAFTSESATGAQVVLGLVPSGNTSVTVTNTDGTSESVPVTNDVYEITSGQPSTVSLKDASGTLVTRHLAALSTVAPSAPTL